MKSFALVFLLLLSGGHQAPASTVSGIVVAADGKALAHAHVTLRVAALSISETTFVTESLSDGRFQFKNIPAGTYRVAVSLSGYVDTEYGQKRPNRPGTVLDLNRPQDVRDLVVRMTAGAVISGRAYSSDGRPLEGVQIQVIRRSYQLTGQMIPQMLFTTRTNDLGEYRIFWLSPGTYYLVATHTDIDFRIRNPVVEQFDGHGSIQLPVFYPNAFDITQATPVKVEAGAEARGIDFTMIPTPTIRVRGRAIIAATGQPAANTPVTVARRTDGWANLFRSSEVRTDRNGNFELSRVPSGSNVLSVATEPRQGRASAWLDLQTGDKDIENLQLLLQPVPNISGQVLINGTTTERVGSVMFIDVSPNDSVFSGPLGSDGHFQTGNGLPGVYRVAVNPTSFYIESARSGSRDVLRDGFEVGYGDNEPLQIVVSPKVGSVQGRVIDENGQPIVGAGVALLPPLDRRNRVELFENATSDQNGSFAIKGVAPGDYRLFAWEDLEPFLYFDPAFMREYESKGIPVHVDENGVVNVSLKAIP